MMHVPTTCQLCVCPYLPDVYVGSLTDVHMRLLFTRRVRGHMLVEDGLVALRMAEVLGGTGMGVGGSWGLWVSE